MADNEVISAFAAYGGTKKRKPAKKSHSPRNKPNKTPQFGDKENRKSQEMPVSNNSTPRPKTNGQKSSKRQKRKLNNNQPTLFNTNITAEPPPTDVRSPKKRRLSCSDIQPKSSTAATLKGQSSVATTLKEHSSKSRQIEETVCDTSVEVPFSLPANSIRTINLPKKNKKKQLSTKRVHSPAPPTNAEPIDPPTNDSVQDGQEFFRWLMTPLDLEKFFQQFWEKNPCLIQRNDSQYFSKLISCAAIDRMLLDNHIEFTKNIDITSYVDGVRDTLNPEGRAMPPVVWGHYEDGCSIRLLNPQTFIHSVYAMNATLQEFFQCMVGTNVYLTPPNSQGFAPHYDDIEAFVLQIEGQKRWKLYNPRTRQEQLARFSSTNFSQDEIGEPILDTVLKPGDVLYFPRGTIHQASTLPGHHSLHVTLSLYQKHSYADLFEIMWPRMISRAIQEEVDLRRGLPMNLWQTMGKVFVDDKEAAGDREDIMKKCQKIMQKVLRHADLDEAVDQLAKRFQHDALPPALTAAEKERTIFGARTTIDKDGRVDYDYEITLDSHVRLLRTNILRVVEEEGALRVYYYVDNSKEYHEYEPNFIEIEPESLSVIQNLIKEYPNYICTSELEGNSDEIRVNVVQGLFERGLLMVDEPIGKGNEL